MIYIAQEADVGPTRARYTTAINLLDTRLRWVVLGPNRTLPSKLKQMKESKSHLILPDKRKSRVYPSSVLFVSTKYPLRY